MVRHNNQLPNAHFHKHWQRYVVTWLNQPGRKCSRRIARQKKASVKGVRPIDLLRPEVRAPTQRYNIKKRFGRGFTLEELRAAGISPKVALSIGIAVDHRRKNRSSESLHTNTTRLTDYLSKIVLFPRKGKAKKGLAGIPADSVKSKLENVKQNTIRNVLPLSKDNKRLVNRVITEEDKKRHVYGILRKARCDAKNVGKKKAEEGNIVA